MDADERDILQKAFAKTKKLFQTKKQAEDWAHNLIEGSNALKTPLQWKHYYAWLANPRKYNEQYIAEMPDCTEPALIKPYDSCMRVETTQNGPYETIINVVHRTDDDEKSKV